MIVISLEGVEVFFVVGVVGVEFVDVNLWKVVNMLKVVVDFNVVFFVGIVGVEIVDKMKLCDGFVCYGLIGVGGMKMKIYKVVIW